MGLDMFLYAKRTFWNFNDADKEIEQKVSSVLPEIDGMEFRSIVVEAGYWRKANQIHRWFVENVQEGKDDCNEYWVSREKLQQLLDLCKQLMADTTKAWELLPTSKGFFFGSTQYDTMYWEDIQHTIDVLEKCLALPENWDFEYRASW